MKADNNLYETAIRAQSFDLRFNAVHWAFDVSSLCRQIAFSWLWMKAYARFYKENIPHGSQPANVNFQVTYFADNCITRIDSCRDKLALLVWAFYDPFNPENRVPDRRTILKKLKNPKQLSVKLGRVGRFLDSLKLLEGDDFRRVEKYRHLKVHRREPRIEIYGVQPHQDWSYMFRLTEEKEIARWEKELEELYPDRALRERVKRKCYIKGELYEQRQIKDRLWDYSEVKRDLESCLFKLLGTSATCFDILRQRLKGSPT